MDLFGPLGIAVLAIAAVVVVGLATLFLRSRVSARRRIRARAKSALRNTTRVEVLETRRIDDERQLVLVRCDEIEHLIMIGGQADLVVENDVKKVRPPAPGAAKGPAQPFQPTPTAAAASPLRVPPAVGASIDAAIAAAAPKGAEAPRTPARAANESRQPAQQPARTSLATVQPPPARPPARGEEAASTSGREDAGRASPQGAQSSEPARRDSAPQRRAQPAPQATRVAEPQRSASNAGTDRNARPGRALTRAAEQPTGLPEAPVPWAEPDSIEDEIVQALRSEPSIRGAKAMQAPREPAKAIIDSSATLGDLADRLEEALAREMQSAGPAHRAPPASGGRPADAQQEPDSARQKRSAERARPEKREQPRSAEEPRRESAPERREEAPVISLNARRREAPDPIEDEMARLLGELTGDTKGR